MFLDRIELILDFDYKRVWSKQVFYSFLGTGKRVSSCPCTDAVKAIRVKNNNGVLLRTVCVLYVCVCKWIDVTVFLLRLRRNAAFLVFNIVSLIQ